MQERKIMLVFDNQKSDILNISVEIFSEFITVFYFVSVLQCRVTENLQSDQKENQQLELCE